MIGNYWNSAWRNLMKRKKFSFINIFGLAVGMASALLILTYVAFEFSFDKMHAKHDRIYRVQSTFYEGQVLTDYWASSSFGYGSAMQENLAGIEDYTRIASLFQPEQLVKYGELCLRENEIAYADPGFFRLFDFELLKGDRASCLSMPGQVVITERIARKYFRDEEPMGKILVFNSNIGKVSCEVTGVMKEMPSNSHIHYNFLSLCNRAVQIPEVFPALGAFPEEYLPLDQTAVAVHSFHNLHLFLRQRILHCAAQVAYILVLINGERNRNLPSLNRPFQTDYRRVNVVSLRDLYHLGHLNIRHVLRRLIPFRPCRGTNGTETDWLDALSYAVIKQLLLLEARMQLHLDKNRLDLAQRQHRFQLRHRHVGHADIPRQPHLLNPLQLPPGRHIPLLQKRQKSGKNPSAGICVILYLPGEGNICISLEPDIFSFTNTPEGL